MFREGANSKTRSEELRTIKTEDIDVESTAKDTNRDHAIPGNLRNSFNRFLEDLDVN